ncbi:lysine transporter LysE [Rhizobium rhizosphaerae]|uniref:Lysine transporter LysE n=1 Tax=Xaviernesmea rhizosphaerae TaxID=1672749 RepID=A0A1Q9AM42_9HYPH|nr:LysE family translocator [Xaviernesmea rhizosphaerae]OLP56366.1 lysine transporter LysE [Xaviernesmea rhizosphaerae]
MADLSVFIGALAVAYLVPGPDMVLILQTGALQGRVRALAVAIGLALARAVHVFLAVVGLAALLSASPWAFEIVRVAGAAYLIWLGVGILRSRSLLPEGVVLPASDNGRSWSAAMRRGLLTNLLNPKALLFCSVLLPQFIRPENGSVPGQFLLLGMILVAVGLVFDLVYAGAGAMLGRWIALHPLVQLLQRWVFAALLIGFGVSLALSQRPL